VAAVVTPTNAVAEATTNWHLTQTSQRHTTQDFHKFNSAVHTDPQYFFYPVKNFNMSRSAKEWSSPQTAFVA